MAFTSDVLVERTGVGQRQTVKEQGNELAQDGPGVYTPDVL